MRNRYVSEAVKCMACTAVAAAQKDYTREAHDADGIHFVVKDQDRSG